MGHGITRRELGVAAGAAVLAGYGFPRQARPADTKTLRFIAQADLRVLLHAVAASKLGTRAASAEK